MAWPKIVVTMPLALQNCPVLAGLNQAALDILGERAVESKVPAGTVIVRAGDRDNHLFLIASGSVRVCHCFDQPDEIDLARLVSGDFFGEMCILEAQPRSATVQALSDCVLHSLTSMAIYHLYQAMPAQHSILILNIARDMSRRLRRADQAAATRHAAPAAGRAEPKEANLGGGGLRPDFGGQASLRQPL